MECEPIRKQLDAYASGQLAGEASDVVRSHVENCPACAGQVAAVQQLRGRLKTAVGSQVVPPELRARVRQRIDAHEPRAPWWARRSNVWALAAAASAVVVAGIWLNHPQSRMPSLTDRPAQNAYIRQVSSSLASIFRVGLGDHIHCSIFRKYPKNPPSVEQMESDLGPSYKGLLPVVKAAAPQGYHVVMAHECGYAGRKFIHFTMQNGGNLVSLVIARKQGNESLNDLRPVQSGSNVPLYQSATQQYQVAAFDSGEYVAFVVSEMRDSNLEIAKQLAPPVHEFLKKSAA